MATTRRSSVIFDMPPGAGPDLTPQNMARGVHALPTWASGLSLRRLELGTPGSTARRGSRAPRPTSTPRFIWWNGNGTRPLNGKQGT